MTESTTETTTETTTPVNIPLATQKRALVIGASSGIGAALVPALAAAGYDVAALARRADALADVCTTAVAENPGKRVLPFAHDVTDTAEIPALFQTIVHELGGLDLVVYVAGVQPAVEPNEYNFEKDRAMIEVNLLGAIAWLNEAAARFQRTGGGQIAAVSSIAGDRGRVGAPVYNTSKAGLNTYLEALRNRLSRHGVTVTTVKPGFVDTVLLANAAKTFWVISPEKAAQTIVQAVEKRKQTVYVPARWGLVGLIIRHMPSFIFRRLNF